MSFTSIYLPRWQLLGYLISAHKDYFFVIIIGLKKKIYFFYTSGTIF